MRISQELVAEARKSYAQTHEIDGTESEGKDIDGKRRVDLENYSYFDNITWTDNNTVEFTVQCAYNYAQTMIDVKCKYNVKEDTLEVK